MTDYIGIDYSLGQSNRDGEYHYGVISQNSVSQYIWDDMESIYWYGCSACGTEFDDDTKLEENEDSQEECPVCGHTEGDDSNWYGDEPIGEIYQPHDGYGIEHSETLCCFFITKSPFYTFAIYCSPCAPGAGDLDSPRENGVKTYCFGEDFFDEYAKCPYPIYSVETGELVFTPEKENNGEPADVA